VIYPNPVIGNMLNVNVSEGWTRAEILTVTGQLVKSYDQHAVTHDGKFDMSVLNEGIYILKIYLEDHTTIIQKFIKR
jgi:hypothetical protein